jgi:hypothetical protein
MKITTPSGYKVELKEETDLTYRDRRSIQKVFLSDTEISNGTDAKNFGINAGTILDAQDALLKIMLLSITDKDGKALEGDLFEVVMNWKNAEDADAIFNVVNEVFGRLNETKKK